MSRLLDTVGHRPWPAPNKPWVMRQDWCDLLFAHWTVPVESLRAVVPSDLELDLFEGEAWLGVVPFRMKGIRARFLPPVPGTSAFPELNVRTYVRVGDKPGVWFFSLDAASDLAVAVARRWFGLPYFPARMGCERRGGSIEYASERTSGSSPLPVFRARYAPTSPVELAEPGTLEHWLTERYCLYSRKHDGRLTRGEIHHAPWPLQRAEAEILEDGYSRAAGLDVGIREPLLHFAREIQVVVWPPEVCKR